MRRFVMVVALGFAGLGLSACGSNACEDLADWYSDNCDAGTTDTSGDSGDCTGDTETAAEKVLECAKDHKAGACASGTVEEIAAFGACVGG